MFDSGSNALYMAVTLLDLPEGSEIIVPSYTWVSCAQAVILAGHKPVFCDVDLHTMNVRSEDIQAQITDKTSSCNGCALCRSCRRYGPNFGPWLSCD